MNNLSARWRAKKRAADYTAFNFSEIPQTLLESQAILRRDSYARNRGIYSDLTLAMSKWLMASLLLLNGGAALATLNAAQHLKNPAFVGSIFVFGILMALLNGWAIQFSASKQVQVAFDAEFYWATVVTTKVRSQEEEEKIFTRDLRGHSLLWIVAIPGWISVAALIAGVLALAKSIR